MYGVTHSITHLFELLCARGDAQEAVRAQSRYLEALPDDASAELAVPGLSTTSAASSFGCAARTRPWRLSSRQRRSSQGLPTSRAVTRTSSRFEIG